MRKYRLKARRAQDNLKESSKSVGYGGVSILNSLKIRFYGLPYLPHRLSIPPVNSKIKRAFAMARKPSYTGLSIFVILIKACLRLWPQRSYCRGHHAAVDQKAIHRQQQTPKNKLFLPISISLVPKHNFGFKFNLSPALSSRGYARNLSGPFN